MLPARPFPRRLVAFAVACAGCTGTPTPRFPPFQGIENEAWLAYEIVVPDRSPDLLASFETSALAYGCRTQHLGNRSKEIVGSDEIRFWYGVSASCDEADIALVTLKGGRVRIGCTKPSTRASCDALLERISVAR